MVFIVSDQRIATENFEKGKIYKVVFLDESIFYGVCIGIGSNFVMLSGNISDYLFPLTMETASQVESIDLYTPVEPEPPVPPMTNLLQYQTGLPPFSFNTSGTNLWSYYIKGNTGGVGERTVNLFDKDSTTIYNAYFNTAGDWLLSADSKSIKFPCLPNTQYTLSVPNTLTVFRIYESSNPNLEPLPAAGNRATEITRNSDIRQYTFTTSSTAQILLFQGTNGEVNEWFNGLMLNTGSTSLPYEPYGYKIPIVCGGQTTNIYIDNPLGADDILYSTQTGIKIPTIVGDNTLSVNTTVQPSEMQIVYNIADR